MSSCCWLRVAPSLTSGIFIINTVDIGKFEHFTMRILANIDKSSTDIFTLDELAKLQKILKQDETNVTLAIKTTQYLLRRMLKFVFKPLNLRNDLLTLGLIEEKADIMVKIWSSETKPMLNYLASDSTSLGSDLSNIKWKLSAELSSDVNKRSKVPKASLELSGRSRDGGKTMELTHAELYGLFLQLESVQTELDNIM